MDFTQLTWLIPACPAICFVLVGFFGKYMGKTKGGYLAIAGVAVAFVLSVLVAYDFYTSPAYKSPGYIEVSMAWFSVGGFEINLGYYIDTLSCVMMLFASFISTLIFIYSLGYMGHEGERKRRYFAEVSLFVTGMLGLAVSGSFLTMFIFWEIMGLCSYLLIGFWSFSHPDDNEAETGEHAKADNAASAAKKAFLVTRLGDVCLMAGLFVLLFAFGSLDYKVVLDGANIANVDTRLILIASVLIFGGVIGKSAQFPLLDWLPDAMAGPTTVSALIHAATMVKAGVYLVARCYPLFVINADMMLFVAIIGGVTAFFAATMAMNNMNIKRVLAYSTLSQLGYMFLALGAGGYLIAIGMEEGNDALIVAGSLGYTAGVLHMMNHAFFKALLFLCSGSVIHSTGTEDMREMGGLGAKMKITSITMLIGSLSIAGFPFFAGFWSKDLIIETVMEVTNTSEFGICGYVFMLLWFLAIVTAFMTAFYMFRMWYMTFRGEQGPRTQHAHGESPKTMTVPLMILSVFAFASGFVILFGFDYVIAFQAHFSVDHWIFQVGRGHNEGFEHAVAIFTNVWTYVTIALVLIAIFLAMKMYDKKTINPGRFNKNGEAWIYKALTKRWWMPQLYNQISWKVGWDVAKGVDLIDRNVVDGTVNGIANAVVGGGAIVGKAQTGNVRNYAAVVMIGVVALLALMVGLFYFMGGL